MAPLQVHIKHSGKVHDLELNPDLPATVFKERIYQLTGVPVDRMKVMVKGGVLKDDASWKKIGPKEGQTFMVIGAAGELPKPPEKPTVFLEDMDEADLAQALTIPVGLKNLGNTCYMNATLQYLHAVPELQTALEAQTNPTSLVNQLRALYRSMSKTTDAVVPYSFLQTLRAVNPQFAEMDRREKSLGAMGGYAQQDAEECLGQILTSLREVPGLPGPSQASPSKRFIEQYFMGHMQRSLKCDEAPEERPSVSSEDVLKLECNITIQTNYLITGIMDALNQKVDKTSPTLGRSAVYTQESRMSRLPSYLQVHMVRFAWRADINKKAKIMRKVKFPLELDGTDFCTPELKEKLLPASRKLKEVLSARAERRKIRKRTKNLPLATASNAAGEGSTAPADGDLPDEGPQRRKEKEEWEALVHDDIKQDVGASSAALYELVAIITHKGAAADAGHYMGYVKKSVFYEQNQPPSNDSMMVDGESSTPPEPSFNDAMESDEDWFKFDDDKVSVFPVEKLATLDGGGEDSSAYMLLYKSKEL